MGFGLGKESGSSCLGFVLEAGCLPVGLAEPLGEVGPVSQAPVDSHCFAGRATVSRSTSIDG